jgi:alpha-beta hydrolase superfamily lysophospholipase
MFVIYAAMASKLDVNIVAYDYTGYGSTKDAGPRPTEKQTYRDIETIYDWCVETGLVQDPAKEIILYGQSVGSGPSCYLASQHATRPVAGLVLHSGLYSLLSLLTICE